MSTNPSAASEDAIAEYIKKKYRAQHEAAQTQGLSAYLKDPPVRGRVNQRFLSNTLRAVAFENRQADKRDREEQERSCSRSQSPEHHARPRHEHRSHSGPPRPRSTRNVEAHTLAGGPRQPPPRSHYNSSEHQGHRTSPSHRSPSHRRNIAEKRGHSTRSASPSQSNRRHTRYRLEKRVRSSSPSDIRNRRHIPYKRSHSQSESFSAEAHRCPAGSRSESRSSSECKRRSPSSSQHDTAPRGLKRKALTPVSSPTERMESPRVPSTTDSAQGQSAQHKDKSQGPFQEDDAADKQLHTSSSGGGCRKPQNVLLPAEGSHGGRPIGLGLQGSSRGGAGLAGSMNAASKGRGSVNVNERVVQLAKQLVDSGVPLEVATARAETQVLTDMKAEGKGSKKRIKKDKKHKGKKHKKEKRSRS